MHFATSAHHALSKNGYRKSVSPCIMLQVYKTKRQKKKDVFNYVKSKSKKQSFLFFLKDQKMSSHKVKAKSHPVPKMLTTDLVLQPSNCSGCFPTDKTHLQSLCGRDPNKIPLPSFEEQNTANCPFLGTLVNEGIIPFDWMINETAWRAIAFGSARNGNSLIGHIDGHITGNFRDHSLWVDTQRNVKDFKSGEDTVCKYWYVNPQKMNK